MRSAVLIAALLSAGCVRPGFRPEPAVPFEQQFNEWARTANERFERTQGHGIDAREPELWERVKREWEALRRDVDAFYRSNK
jgi:hypothetical protein